MLQMYYGERALHALRAIADVHCNDSEHDLPEADLAAAARECDALIAYRQTPAAAGLFARLPRLAVFLRCAMDIRTVDVAAASAHGVLVTHASAGFNAAVAEWVLAMMVNLARGIGVYHAAYRRGETPPPVMGKELRGATLGIIGFGGIGQQLGTLALALGMRLAVTTLQALVPRERVHPCTLPELLAQSDFVVCLAPARPETAHLIDAAALAAMKPGAFFINASRGELVDEAALLAALDSGRLAGCALDVGQAPDQMPSPALARHPRVIATPHVGGLTLPAVEHQALETVQQLHALLQGRVPDGAVNAAHATRWQGWGRG
jgi:D-3-phosphoglycerate dehydrogenase